MSVLTNFTWCSWRMEGARASPSCLTENTLSSLPVGARDTSTKRRRGWRCRESALCAQLPRRAQGCSLRHIQTFTRLSAAPHHQGKGGEANLLFWDSGILGSEGKPSRSLQLSQCPEKGRRGLRAQRVALGLGAARNSRGRHGLILPGPILAIGRFEISCLYAKSLIIDGLD